MASGSMIPKEQQSAYQCWDLGSLETPGSAPVRPVSGASTAAEQQAQQMQLHARSEGYREGHREGLEAAGREALAETAPRIARMDELLAALTTDLTRVDRELAKVV